MDFEQLAKIENESEEQYVLRSGVLKRLQAEALLLHHQLF